MRAAPVRENSLGRVSHPESLRVGGEERHRIDDPLAARIANGDPVFGWGGDERLALYLNRRRGCWDLMRLEHDGVYRVTISTPGFVAPQDLVPQLILRLVATDSRRGFNAVAAADAANARRQAALDADAAEFRAEAADRLHHALTRDVGHLEGGTRRLHAVNTTPKD